MLSKISWRLILILISAGIIAFLTFRYLDSLQETKKIVVSTTEIPEKTIIEKDMLKTVTVEANAADTLVQDQVSDIDKVIGAITREKIDEGEPMKLDPDLIVFPEKKTEYLKNNGDVDYSKFIPDDKRLFTLGLEPDKIVDNRIKKGDYVDIIYTGTVEYDNQEEVYSRMILQYVEVYDIEKFDDSQLAGAGKDSMIQHITLMVDPQDAVALANAQEEGQLSLTLNPSEGEEVEVQMIYESTFEN